MSAKLAHWEWEAEMGMMVSEEFPAWHGKTPCVDGIADAIPGKAGHQFKCKNVSRQVAHLVWPRRLMCDLD